MTDKRGILEVLLSYNPGEYQHVAVDLLLIEHDAFQPGRSLRGERDRVRGNFTFSSPDPWRSKEVL